MTTWHARLTKAREAAGLNKIELAKAVGVSTATTTDWEKDDEIKKLTCENLLRICQTLNVSPWWLWFGEEEVLPSKEASAVAAAFDKLEAEDQEIILGMLQRFLGEEVIVDHPVPKAVLKRRSASGVDTVDIKKKRGRKSQKEQSAAA